MKNLKNIVITLALLLSCAGLAACGVGPDKSREDAVDTTDVDKAPAHVVAFNNHYPNVATKCDGYGHRVYVVSRIDGTVPALPVVIDDPSCP